MLGIKDEASVQVRRLAGSGHIQIKARPGKGSGLFYAPFMPHLFLAMPDASAIAPRKAIQ